MAILCSDNALHMPLLAGGPRQANQGQGRDRIRGEPIAAYHRAPFAVSVLARPGCLSGCCGWTQEPIALESGNQLRGLRVVVLHNSSRVGCQMVVI